MPNIQGCSISNGAQYVTLQKYFSHPSLVISCFCNPTHKSETGTTNRCHTTNSNQPGAIIMMGRSETLISSQIIFITLFSGGIACFFFPDCRFAYTRCVGWCPYTLWVQLCTFLCS